MKKISALILCLVIAVSFAACGTSSDKAASESLSFNNQSADYFAVTEDSAELYSYTDSAGGAGEAATQQTQNEKIIKTVELSVETREYEAYIAALNATVSAAGGYVETSTANLGNNIYSNRYATFTVRIPADNLEAFISTAGEKGTITSKTENQQNVTLEYVDLESRIDAYKTEKNTLTGLLEKAESLENVLAIQERLSEVNYQIETYTSQLKVLENRVSYSTVTLRISEVERVSVAEPNVWTRIKNRFLDNLDGLVDWFKDAVVAVVGGLPVIVPLAAAILIVILIVKKIIRKRRGF